ncbi:hypothetical protein QUG97_28030, partial [Klebsiella michiganensis]|uniref:hypothetical protein n=1 Tax=Klebsiella michiganensis TaxID=1134687 RepID=UPI0025A194D5
YYLNGIRQTLDLSGTKNLKISGVLALTRRAWHRLTGILIDLLICVSEFCPFFRHIPSLNFFFVSFISRFFGLMV